MSFEKRLLDPFAGHVAGNRRVVGLARDLVDLVDVHDARLRLLHVVVALLQKFLNDVLDILSDVARLRQRRGVGDGERNVEEASQCFREQSLPAAGRADQKNVALGKLHLLDLDPRFKPLVMVVHGNGENLLGMELADDVVVENAVDLMRSRQSAR